MKVLVVHPGASWATHDVHMGVLEGLRACGVPCAEFRLDGRIQRTHDFLHFLWRRQKRTAPERAWPKPTAADVVFQASHGLIERALERGCTDIVVVSATYVLPERLELARRAGLRVWLLCTETPYDLVDELRVAALVNGVWTHERSALEAFRAVNPNVSYLPHAWRDGVHNLAPTGDVPSCDVLFCGSLFPERLRWFEAIDWTGIDLALYGTPELLPARSKLRAFVRGGLVNNADLPRLARGAKVVLNLFRQPPAGAVAESLNPRCYEMAAAGVCLISDPRPEVVERFGDAVLTCTTPAEAEALIRALLADAARRQSCATRARTAVAGETWLARARTMIATMQQWSQEQFRRSA